MQRFYFLVPKLSTTKHLVNELQDLGVGERDIYVLGSQERVQAAHFHFPGLLRTSDVQSALKKGAIIGGLLGFLAGVLILLFPIDHLSLSYGFLIGITAFGGVFGAWTSSMIGVSVNSPVVEKFQQAIKSGQFLMIVDFKSQDEATVIQLIKSRHPEVIINRVNLLNAPTEVWDRHDRHHYHIVQ